jgi:hypothetical protein
LAAVIRRYLTHLDFDAPTQLDTVRIEASGPGLHVAYAEHDTNQPMLSVSINDFSGAPPESPEDMQQRKQGGWLR